jgi:hypothetical protein
VSTHLIFFIILSVNLGALLGILPPKDHSLQTTIHSGTNITPYATPEGTSTTSDHELSVEDLEGVIRSRTAITQTLTQKTTLEESLPDLQSLPPSDLRLFYDPSTGRKLVRFTNSILNSGPGRLELVGHKNPEIDQILVYQRIYATDGKFLDQFEIGKFVYHEPHDHWHLDGFVQYEVRLIQKESNLNAVVAGGSKLSYCLLDVDRTQVEPPGTEYPQKPRYTVCNGDIQGLSPGWIDVYEHNLSGQWVEITYLPDGVYALVTTANPTGFVQELDTNNNIGVTYFELKDLQLLVVEEPIMVNLSNWSLLTLVR